MLNGHLPASPPPRRGHQFPAKSRNRRSKLGSSNLTARVKFCSSSSRTRLVGLGRSPVSRQLEATQHYGCAGAERRAMATTWRRRPGSARRRRSASRRCRPAAYPPAAWPPPGRVPRQGTGAAARGVGCSFGPPKSEQRQQVTQNILGAFTPGLIRVEQCHSQRDTNEHNERGDHAAAHPFSRGDTFIPQRLEQIEHVTLLASSAGSALVM